VKYHVQMCRNVMYLAVKDINWEELKQET